jgi:hypothetical protein
MRKFISQTIKGKTTIYECEVFIATPRPFGLHPGEQLYIVAEPKQFLGYEWFSIFFQDTLELAKKKLEEITRAEFDRCLVKNGVQFTEQNVLDELSKVETAFL